MTTPRAPHPSLRILAPLSLALLILLQGAPPLPTEGASHLVQASHPAAAAARVLAAGGVVTGELGIIRAVTAELTPAQVDSLRAVAGVTVYENRQARAAGMGGKGGSGEPCTLDCNGNTTAAPDTDFPRRVGAPALWAQGIKGQGVTVAIVDTGARYTHVGLKSDTAGANRVRALYDALTNQEFVFPLDKKDRREKPQDQYGHGTHVAGVILNSEVTPSGDFGGVAPDARLVVVRALGDDGVGTYASVIAGIDWVVQNQDRFGIRVLNLSLSAPPQSHYWADPLAQAVMAAWQSGLVVVASAGNTGPEPMTIGVPGNVPYVLTVGAMSDAATPAAPGDDFLTSFSAAGPTHEGFVKPELVAPGGHVTSTMQASTTLATEHADYRVGDQYFMMSGTSQAAGVVSGVAALLLSAQPALSPDEVKCRLMASARPAVDELGNLAYSVFQQGAGMAWAPAAVSTTAAGCANQGLDVGLDLLGHTHFVGRANRAPDGTYFLTGLDGDGFSWSDGYMWSDGFAWSDAYIWNDGFAWSDAYIWNDGFAWSDSIASFDGYIWSDSRTEPMSVNVWVDQE